ncbi:MAG TPA: BatD family protein [Polyangiaceae bacterium]|nr:BatD family protein [Polyangiaceae bacterium]
MSTRALAGFGGAFAVLCFAGSARAQVSVETQIGAHKIELGDSVQFEITATSSTDEAPQNPHLGPVPGLSLRGPSLGSRTQVSINNGRMVRQSGISATWSIQAVKVGTYRIGPASVDFGSQHFQGQVETLEVVPQGTLPRGPRGGGGQPFDPFRFLDPFGGGSPFPQGLFPQNDQDQEQEELPPVPDEYKVDRAPDPLAFVRVTVTPKHPVVGEQVTVRFYAYGGRGMFRISNSNEATHPDFLDYTGQDDSIANGLVRVPIGDNVFIAGKVRELCLFPLHAGRLTIGAFSLTFDGGPYRANPPVTRSTAPVTLDVTEPPLDGRPAGYRVGDVGTLELSAAVDPRKVVAGDAVSVVAKLEGTGSIPTALRVPEQRGVEWLEPTHVDEVNNERGTVRGFRAFTYIVKLHDAGNVELGNLTLPYWDPKKRVYATARAELGKVEVAPNPQAAPSATASAAASAAADFGDPLALKTRRTLAPYAKATTPFTDGMRFWYLLFGAPFAVALSGVGVDLGGRLLRSRKASRSSPQRLAQESLRAAEVAARGSEIAKTAGAVERALFLAIEAGTGIRARALLKDDLKASLAGAGVDTTTVERTLELLDACESARFTGKSGELSPKELCARARGLVGELSRKRRSA